MCAPRVTRHTSIRYSSSCHTRVNMGSSIFFTTAIILAFRLKSRASPGILPSLFLPGRAKDLPAPSVLIKLCSVGPVDRFHFKLHKFASSCVLIIVVIVTDIFRM